MAGSQLAPLIGADVEVGQRALEEERDHRADRVAVVEDRDAVPAADPLDLGGERRVIGRVERLARDRAISAALGSRPSRQIGWPSKSVVGHRPVVFCPG